MTKSRPEPLLDVARGDAARSHVLRESLKILRDRSGDPAFGKLVDDVLTGRRGLREAVASPLFNQALTPGVQEAAQRYKGMSEEERERLAADGEDRLNRLRDELSKPVSPDDDEDFGDTGYLQPSR
ncbi:hypothetical protein ACFOWZ_08045 [Lentzea rhizosphaerae]|uniref:Excreted virulence factor EspC, type VII ESX diderm n=1 Tax=Lentzea rhizosphaerae TaxID=2041025 RepID=A0ABV8BPL8_9PSEU